MADERRIGMSPATVAHHRAVIGGQLDALHDISGSIARTGWASLHPVPAGLVPGMLILTGGSVLLAQHAAADVVAAAASAHDLLARLSANIDEQRLASSATDGYLDGLMSKRQADALYDRVMKDPGALSQLTPQQVQAWWGRLSEEQRDTFVRQNHWVAGNTNGIPFDRRVEANKLSALELMRDPSDMSADQADYLAKVATGEITLISFDPAADRIIEMVGEIGPETKNIVNFVPGTLASMDKFYDESTQQLGRVLAADAIPPGSTVVFIYKDAPFPDFGPRGVYNTSWAASVGEPYHDFNTALGFENPGHIPVTSIEHSFGSSVGGYAESQGTHFDSRIVLGGIGMTEDWKPDPATNYYSFTGPDDIIRLGREKGSDDLNIGYPEPPTTENGFHELATGFKDVPSPVFPWDVKGYLDEAANQHGRVAGVDNNQVVISQIEALLGRNT